MAARHGEHTASPAGTGSGEGFPICPECRSHFRQLHHEDLFLSLACALGDRVAWEQFADEYLDMLKRFAAQACHNLDASEDLAQELVTVLLGESVTAVEARRAPESSGPRREAASGGKLLTYNGRGSLAGWLRAAVAHAAIDRFRRSRKQVSLEDLPERARAVAEKNDAVTSEQERLDARWGPLLARCLGQELSRLGARDRLLLSLYYLQGVPLKAIGLRFGVHEATASRWLERLRRDLRKRVEREMRKTHGLNARELSALWRWVAEKGDLTIGPSLELVPSGGLPQKKVQGGIV